MAQSSEHIREPDNIDIPSMIDHTLLNPMATMNDIKRLCDEAVRYQFFSVCVNPCYISRCKELLHETGIKVCTVVGFPLGANMPDVKAFEAQHAESMGADEIDMVINIGALKERDLLLVREEIAGVVNATRKQTVTKVILENAYLTMEEKIFGCLSALEAGADFVKTSTGFAPSGATIEDVALMRYIIGEKMGVKAAGGIRDRKSAFGMIKAGANRIGTSSSVKIVNEGDDILQRKI
ncbi:MAG: deoxyribose-phosphate aldolase [bacterium]